MAPPMAIKDSDSLIALIAEASMNSMDRSERYARLSILAAVLELLLAVGALGGGLALMLGPNGEILPAPLSLVQESAFTNNFTPGLILFVALGCGPLMVALLVWRRHLWAPSHDRRRFGARGVDGCAGHDHRIFQQATAAAPVHRSGNCHQPRRRGLLRSVGTRR